MRERYRVRLFAALVLLCSPVGFAAEPLKLPLVLKVEAGSRERVDAVVRFSVSGLESSGQSFRLIETNGGQELPVAVQLDSQAAALSWIANGKTPAGSTRTYRLEAGAPAAANEIKVVDSQNTLEVRFEDKPLLQYNKAHVEPPAGVNPRYGRSAHLHPVRTPSGAVVTDELP